jgi:RNA recognition motif-containing protein
MPTPSATDEARLREEFSKFGTVTEVFLPTERSTQRPRGFGFVTLQTREAAENAISKLDQSQLDGRTIRVNESRPKGSGPSGDSGRPSGPGGSGGFNSGGKEEVKLYVGNLAFDTTQESIQKLFEQYGTVTDCFMPTDRDSGKVRGFCFVTMPSSAAEEACRKLNGYEVDGRAIRVNEAQPKGSGGGGRGGGYGDGYGGGGGGGYGGGGYGGGGYGGTFVHASWRNYGIDNRCFQNSKQTALQDMTTVEVEVTVEAVATEAAAEAGTAAATKTRTIIEVEAAAAAAAVEVRKLGLRWDWLYCCELGSRSMG